MSVKAKKFLGQHFLKDKNIAKNIVEALILKGEKNHVLEIGPGMGVLTEFLIVKENVDLKVIEIDKESVVYLEENFEALKGRIVEGDFLRLDLNTIFEDKFFVIGNFPYNISSQIFFRVLDYKDKIPQVVGMVQREVGRRIASPPGNKDYGILSVLLQAYYKIDYLFTVPEHVFKPEPKVKSGVIRLVRNEVKELGCDEKLFVRVVKQGFNNRRKTLRNALKPLSLPAAILENPVLNKRAEELSVEQFVNLTLLIQNNTN